MKTTYTTYQGKQYPKGGQPQGKLGVKCNDLILYDIIWK